MNFATEDFQPIHVSDIGLDMGFSEKKISMVTQMFTDKVRHGAAKAGLDLATGKAFYLAGISVKWPGVAETFSLGGTNGAMQPYRGGVTKFCKEQIEAWAELYKLHRIHGDLAAKADMAEHNFMLKLGFRRESLMPGWGPDGTDFIRYRRLFPPALEV